MALVLDLACPLLCGAGAEAFGAAPFDVWTFGHEWGATPAQSSAPVEMPKIRPNELMSSAEFLELLASTPAVVNAVIDALAPLGEVEPNPDYDRALFGKKLRELANYAEPKGDFIARAPDAGRQQRDALPERQRRQQVSGPHPDHRAEQ